MDFKRLWTYLVGVALAAFDLVPRDVQKLAAVALALFLADTLTGMAAAHFDPNDRVTSKKLGTATARKFVVYGGIIFLCHMLAVLSATWLWASMGWSVMCAAEGGSVIENLRRIQGTGVNLGPVGKLLDLMAAGFTAIANLATASAPKAPDSPTEPPTSQP